jgi:ABC-type glycerol-3-phosphate transport system substrate-binding protein
MKLGAFLFALMLAAPSVVWASGGQSKGKEVIIGNFWMNYDTGTYKPVDEADELVFEWRKKIQKDHGVTIKEKMVAGYGEMQQTITTSVMAGRPAAQAFHVTPDWAMSLKRQNLLAPISDNKTVDLTTTTSIPYRQAVYNQEVNKLFTFGGKIYAICYGYGGSRHSVGIFFNKRLFKEAGLDPDLPYDMQKAGTWTWDAYVEICKKLTRDRNNTGQYDTYAICGQFDDNILEAMLHSNGAQFVDRDASGKFVNASNRPEFIEALQFCLKLREMGVMMPRPEGSNWNWAFSAFTDGNIAMLTTPEWVCGSLAAMADDWGYVLPPKGPRAKDYIFGQDENVTIIPSTYKGETLDMIVSALNLWYTPVSDDWKAGLWSSYRDRRAVEETMAMIRGPGRGVFRNYMMIPGFETGDLMWQLWWWDGEPAQLIESVSLNWNALIDDANNFR